MIGGLDINWRDGADCAAILLRRTSMPSAENV